MRRDVSTTMTGILVFLSWSPLAKGDTSPSAPTNAQVVKLGKESHLWVEGDSTLHKFRLDAKELQLEIGSPGSTAEEKLDDLVTRGGIKSLDLRVALLSLTSGEKGLDDNMRRALKADQNHEIRFQMDSYQSSPGPDAAHLSLQIKGRLQIAGVQKPIELDAAAARDGAALHVTGTKQLLMTDYGVKPPTFMIAMSCKDAVTIHFDLRLTLVSP